jgi:autotransporter translocation and assembly factor TamB
VNGVGNGAINFSSNGIRTRGLELRQLNTQCSVANNVLYLNDFRTDLSDQEFVRADGTLHLGGQHRYSARVVGNISNLSKLQPLLRSFGNENNVGGSLVVDWSGSGDAIRFKNSGQLKLTLQNGQYGNLKSLQANIDASYSPEGLDIPTIFFRTDQMDFQAIVQAKGETLEITKIQLDQGQAKYASGYLSIPFIWRNLGTNAAVIPSSGKVVANFQTENIDIKKVFQDFGAKPLASGTLNVKLDAEGTISRPAARLEIEAHDLRAEQLPKFEPATFHLGAQSADGQLAITGKFEQAKVQPIQLTANVPFDVPRIARDGKFADSTPLKANVKMPRSSVNFVRQFVPAVQEVDGDAAIDVDVTGTVGRPEFKGQADMAINVARALDPTLPALQNFKGRLTFANQVLTLDQFAGELSGGRFSAAGHISVPNLKTADVDLAFKADSALIARSDTLAIRTNADIRLQGPISSVNVTGNVALTNSHVLKNLDLIPITLPGRPPPQPAVAHPRLILPPQFKDWKFDVAITTKDPVLVRGNLATGGAIVDLRFAGAGSRPGLNGLVRLENVEATLPFSRLDIAYGFLYFNPDDSLNPKIDLHGTSTIQDYTVHVYIYGTALAPQAVFNSEPPLPQEDLISLLSTGTTRQQLTGNNNVLAGRAAMLLFQQVYRRVFKKGQATQSNSVFDRFDLDVGTVDPRTGQQQATARFKINNQFMLIGDLGVGGDYKGMVKYLIRFH